MRAGASSTAATVWHRGLAVRLRAVLVGGVALAAAAIALGLVFAGSPAKLAPGLQVAGMDVGGLTVAEAEQLLARRFERLQHRPVTFVADGRRFRVTPARLGVKVDWAAAVESARREGEGFGPVRGFRRLHTRLFGTDVAPPTEVYGAALAHTVRRIARQVDRRPRAAALRFVRLQPVVVPDRDGLVLDRRSAEEVIVRALASLGRAPVGLPVHMTAPAVTARDLQPALAEAQVAVSAPVRLDLGTARWRLTRQRLAELIQLPAGGRTGLAVGGKQGDRFLARIAKLVERRAVSASFAVRAHGSVRVVPALAGLQLERPATASALLAAAASPTGRLATIRTRSIPPNRTTAEARSLGITRTLAVYSTAYAGTPDRIHNLQLAVSLLDGTLVPPGGTFSLNQAVGERTPERGFRRAPVIVGTEYGEDYGGGTSQVATTVFNAAWEAGLKIAERHPHALYISRYPLGRDATVNYPTLDLKFVNDTKRWILAKGWSTDTGISIGLYGAPTGRKIVSEAGPLTVIGPVPVEATDDPALPKGERVVDAAGAPPSSVTVTRKVYLRSGKLLYDETWRTTYSGEKRLVRVGTKPAEQPVETATTATTATTPAEKKKATPPGR